MSDVEQEKRLNIQPLSDDDLEQKTEKEPEILGRPDNLDVLEQPKMYIPKQKDPKKVKAGKASYKARMEKKRQKELEQQRIKEERDLLSSHINSRMDDDELIERISNRLFEKMNSLKSKPEPEPKPEPETQKRKIPKPMKVPEPVIQTVYKESEPVYQEPVVKKETALERRKRLRGLMR